MRLVLSRAVLPAVLLCVGGAFGGRAQTATDTPLPTGTRSPRQMFELSAGVDGKASSWSTYTNLTAALLADIRQNGYRVRIGGGYGQYSYSRPVFDAATHDHVSARFRGQLTWYDVLVGYQWTLGSTTVKAFAGLTSEDHRITPAAGSPLDVDEDNFVQGRKSGTKIVLETWSRLADWGFFQIDANWSEPFKAYGGRLRLGHFLDESWSVGLETAAFGNRDYSGGRIGAFARYEWAAGEISISAGADGDLDRIGSGYGSVAFSTRF